MPLLPSQGWSSWRNNILLLLVFMLGTGALPPATPSFLVLPTRIASSCSACLQSHTLPGDDCPSSCHHRNHPKTCLTAKVSSDDSSVSNRRHPTPTTDESSSLSSSPSADTALLHLSRLLRPPSFPLAANTAGSSNMVAAVQVDRMSSTDLAYIGDVVYELFIRSHMIYPPRRTSELQECVVAVVRAEYQAHILQSLLLLQNNNNGNDSNNASNNASTNDSSSSSDSGSNSNHDDDDNDAGSGMFVLTMQERRVVSRGRNAVSGGSKRRGRKNNSKSAAKDYQDATALEALIGHVYISNPLRCAQLLSYIQQEFLFSPSSRVVEKES